MSPKRNSSPRHAISGLRQDLTFNVHCANVAIVPRAVWVTGSPIENWERYEKFMFIILCTKCVFSNPLFLHEFRIKRLHTISKNSQII